MKIKKPQIYNFKGFFHYGQLIILYGICFLAVSRAFHSREILGKKEFLKILIPVLPMIGE